MRITCDWHIHSRNSCDSACMTVDTLVARAAELGIADFGLTDHVHSPFNWPDVLASRREFDAAERPAGMHFGVEASCVSRWELDEIASGRHASPVYGLRQGGPAGGELALGLTAEMIDEAGVEYVVAGTHWPMYVPMEREAIIRDYHRQNVFLACHPLVDFVANPWWWMGGWQNPDGTYSGPPWLDDFGHVPQSLHDEFAAAAIEHGTVVEVNLSANLLHPGYPERFRRQYAEYVAGLKARGVMLTLGSDCHKEHYEIDFPAAAAMLEAVGIGDEDFWRLPPRE